MNSRDGNLREVSLVNFGSQDEITSSIENAIGAREFGWRTIRVGEDGTIRPHRVRSEFLVPTAPGFSLVGANLGAARARKQRDWEATARSE